jgi:hypothetical protein
MGVARCWGVVEWVNGYEVSVEDDEEVPERNRSDSCETVSVLFFN